MTPAICIFDSVIVGVDTADTLLLTSIALLNSATQRPPRGETHYEPCWMHRLRRLQAECVYSVGNPHALLPSLQAVHLLGASQSKSKARGDKTPPPKPPANLDKSPHGDPRFTAALDDKKRPSGDTSRSSRSKSRERSGSRSKSRERSGSRSRKRMGPASARGSLQ